MHYIYNSSTTRYDWYIVRSSDNTTVSFGSATSNNYSASGSRIIFSSGVNIYSYLLNGTVSSINENGTVQKQSSYDDGTNIILFYRSDTSANNVSLLSTTAFSRQSINKNPGSSVVRVVSETGALFGFNSPFALRIVYPEIVYSYDESDSAISYNSANLKTEQSYAVRVSSSLTGRTGWITFSRDTASFNKDMATQTYGAAEGVQTNYVYS